MTTYEEFQTIIYSDLSWHEKALCKGVTHLFFLDKGQNNSVRQAKLICKKCQVSTHCLKYALDNNIKHGVWGGYSRKERLKIKKASR